MLHEEQGKDTTRRKGAKRNKKVEKLKKGEVEARKGHLTTHQVSLQLAKSFSEVAQVPNQLGEQMDNSATCRMDRQSRSCSPKVPEQFVGGVKTKCEKKHNSADRRVDR
uniref:Uncharacterized protein n=1 Tax=Solanum tuberosum TaxID=4113 RepID=M1DYC3_SOLTU